MLFGNFLFFIYDRTSDFKHCPEPHGHQLAMAEFPDPALYPRNQLTGLYSCNQAYRGAFPAIIY
ncbi:MAG: hypothetical protein A3Q59_01250 [Methanomethylophilus alvi]|nr:MAG: hypothetical protein A3Q59_01250 [Methanomethylophilus alvi]